MSETDGRPPKRVRTDEGGTDLPVEELIRDREFWLEDGNVVLVAGKHAFKIYRGLLAMQSPVFAGMFATANPAVGPLYDGCPVVRLFDDSAEDLRHLLHALLPKAETSISPADDLGRSCSFNELSSLTRLGHKYQIEFIEHRAIARLKVLYTDSLDKWDQSNYPFDFGDGQEIGAVGLARLTNNPDMLPMAFYYCSILGGAVARGWTREDGTMETLQASDLERCINGYGVLQNESPESLARIFASYDNPRCTASPVCNYYLSQFHQWARAMPERFWLLHSWKGTYEQWMTDNKIGLCLPCLEALSTREINERRAIWRKLPTIFGLPTPDRWEA